MLFISSNRTPHRGYHVAVLPPDRISPSSFPSDHRRKSQACSSPMNCRAGFPSGEKNSLGWRSAAPAVPLCVSFAPSRSLRADQWDRSWQPISGVDSCGDSRPAHGCRSPRNAPHRGVPAYAGSGEAPGFRGRQTRCFAIPSTRPRRRGTYAPAIWCPNTVRRHSSCKSGRPTAHPPCQANCPCQTPGRSPGGPWGHRE